MKIKQKEGLETLFIILNRLLFLSAQFKNLAEIFKNRKELRQ